MHALEQAFKDLQKRPEGYRSLSTEGTRAAVEAEAEPIRTAEGGGEGFGHALGGGGWVGWCTCLRRASSYATACASVCSSRTRGMCGCGIYGLSGVGFSRWASNLSGIQFTSFTGTQKYKH